MCNVFSSQSGLLDRRTVVFHFYTLGYVLDMTSFDFRLRLVAAILSLWK